MELIKFDKKDAAGISKYYVEHGYVIISNLNSAAVIDEFISEYEKFKKKSNFLINAQDTNRPEKLRINQEGFIENSIMDPLDITFAGKFSDKAKKVIINEGISKLLAIVTRVDVNVQWQSMFFDKSTGTVIHQDAYYLDSDPPGKLVGVWYALEDIELDAGCFYVCPKTHVLGKILFAGQSHKDYVQSMLAYTKENQISKVPCPLKKGDVLFWNSFTLHGSFENTNPKFSRKSFTAHFIPAGMNRKAKKIPKLTESGVKGILTRKKISALEKLRYMKTFTKYLLVNKLSNKVDMEMKSKEYNER
jgi:phytanoyl-CoA hydroxylase